MGAAMTEAPARAAQQQGRPARVQGTVGSLVALSVRSDHAGELLSFLSATVGRPVALVDHEGSELASAPAGRLAGDTRAQALELARADLDATTRTGWQVLPLGLGQDPLGYLLVLAEPPLDPDAQALVDIARLLIADQLRRASLAARVLSERRSALKRRLITDAQLSPGAVNDESGQAQMTLAAHYWLAIVCCERGEIATSLLARIEDLVHRHAREHVAVRQDAQTIVLLIAQDGAGAEHELEVRLLVDQVVELARARVPGSSWRGIVAKASVPLADVAVQVDVLRRLGRYLQREHGLIDDSVQSERSLALVALLETIDRRRAAAFVTSQIGPLLSYDRAHGTHLADVLEIGLDIPDREEAARAAYMHRNTLRRHLNHAMELIDRDLAHPDERLAVHLALKLANLLEGILVESRRSPRRT
jgi:DNA-binding PucR family transcriptional regulator